MVPPQSHFSVEVSFSAGALPSSTVGHPVTQGQAIAGRHGIGVSTPIAAEVAAATAGLVGLEHIPKGGMFTIGLLSKILAAGMDPVTS